MKMPIWILPSLSFLVLAGCDGSSGNKKKSSDVTEAKKADTTTTDLDEAEILSKAYALKVESLIFSESEGSDIVIAEGTRFETEMRLYRKYFQGQRSIQGQDVSAGDQYCTVFATASKNERISEIGVQGGELHTGQIATEVRKHNGRVVFSFSLQLQREWNQSFTLQCFNTPNSQTVRQHVGHLLEITEPIEQPAPPVVIEPKSLSVQYLTAKDAIDSAMISHTLTIAADDLPTKEIREVRVTAHRRGLDGSFEPLVDSQLIYSSNASLIGDLAVTFGFSSEESVSVLDQLQIARYTLEINGEPRLILDLEELCRQKPDSFLDLGSNSSGCPAYVPVTELGQELSKLAICSEDEIDYQYVRAIRAEQASGGTRPEGACQGVIWELIGLGLSDGQINYVDMYRRHLPDAGTCRDLHSNYVYQTLRQIEREEELVYRDSAPTPVPDESLFEVCLSGNREQTL